MFEMCKVIFLCIHFMYFAYTFRFCLLALFHVPDVHNSCTKRIRFMYQTYTCG